MDTLAKIKQRRKQLIIHSCLYYYFNESIISDATFDKWCKELVELHDKYPDYTDDNDRYFTGFDGSTGYHLGNSTNALTHYSKIKGLMTHHLGVEWSSDRVREYQSK